MTPGRLASVQIGPIAPLGPDAVPSGFMMSGVAGPVRVGTLGLAGDAQADLRVHGGPEKAVYAYPAQHHAAWGVEYPEHATRFVAGGVGENLTITGLTEADLCVGDVHAIGSARLQVCQPRQPCFKFALRFGDPRLPNAMIRNERSGWYYRVLEEGEVRAGDAVTLVDRETQGFAFARLVTIVYRRTATHDEWAALAASPGLASDLREGARRRIA